MYNVTLNEENFGFHPDEKKNGGLWYENLVSRFYFFFNDDKKLM